MIKIQSLTIADLVRGQKNVNLTNLAQQRNMLINGFRLHDGSSAKLLTNDKIHHPQSKNIFHFFFFQKSVSYNLVYIFFLSLSKEWRKLLVLTYNIWLERWICDIFL